MADVFEHPWLSGLFGDDEVAAIWSPERQLAHMIAFEAAWSRAGAVAGLWSAKDGEAAARAMEQIDISAEELRAGTGRDGVGVPTLVSLLKQRTNETAIHRGATSQDVTDTALAMTLSESLELFIARLNALRAELEDLSTRLGNRPLMGRTRMQAALPVTVGHRIEAWQAPMAAHVERLRRAQRGIGVVQIGGPVGDRAALGESSEDVVIHVAQALGLSPAKCWHTDRSRVFETASVMAMVTGSLGKMGQDIALMAQQGLDAIQLAGGGRSSAMAHKNNPVLAELLVTLAHFNATQSAGMAQTMIHEQERSGVSWALEWMILPSMAFATGRSLAAARELLGQIETMGDM